LDFSSNNSIYASRDYFRGASSNRGSESFRQRPANRPERDHRTARETPASVGSGGKSARLACCPRKQLDARLDEVLAKIAREGRAGLTEEEFASFKRQAVAPVSAGAIAFEPTVADGADP